MSGATIGGVVGAVVGSFIPGVGTQVGWMIGSAIGGYVDPTQVFGPRLTDVRGQTSSVGGAIPRAWGTAPVPGNIIWQQPGVTEHKNTDDGKGSGTEQVTYTYTRSYAVMFHLGEIAGVLQIKRNGKIVYDARDDATLEDEYTRFGMTAAAALERITGQRAENSKFMSRCVIYTGTQTQDPDPTIESYLGVGNASAYRGRAYFVVTDDETQAGEIAQFEVVVAVCGVVSTIPGAGGEWLITPGSSGAPEIEISPDGLDWTGGGTIPGTAWGPGNRNGVAKHGNSILLIGAQPIFSNDRGVTWLDVTSEHDPDGGAGICLYHGGYWHAQMPHVVRSSDGVNFVGESGAPIVDVIGKAGNRLVGVRSSTPATVYTSDGFGGPDSWELAPSISGGVVAGPSMADDGARLCLTSLETGAYGGGGASDYRFKIRSTIDGESWTDHANPFSDVIDPIASTDTCVHYSAGLGLWFVSFFDRIAYGPTLDSLVLSDHVFHQNILHIDSDRGKVVVCGPGAMLEYSLDGDDWIELTSGTSPSQPIYVAASLADISEEVPIPDAPGWYTDGQFVLGPAYDVLAPCGTTTVGEIVADLCELSGLTSDEYDVSQLTDTLDGYVIARETDAASVIESLRQIGMWDPAEWDGKFRGIKRGGVAVASINGDDLVEREGDAYERELVQESELLRKCSVGYLDTKSAWAPNTQAWERRVGTINARGESVVEVTAVMGADQAATVAKRKGLTAWGEPEKQRFSLPYRLAALTPTDVVNYTHSDGEVYTDRLMQIEDDSGIRYVEAATNCAEAYSATTTGVQPKPPTITDASLRGPTQLVVMDLPIWRTGDADDIGLYAAVRGYPGMGGWTGADVEISLDGGASYAQSVQATDSATIGYTTTDLMGWVGSENPEDLEVTVYLPSAPSSVTYETLLTYANRAAVLLNDGTWAILQYQTVTPLGDDQYTLSGIIHGRFNTTPGEASAGAAFVLLNNAVQFVTAPRDAIGETLTVRATTYGTSSDAAIPFDYEFTEAASQTEWPVHNVEAIRDGGDNVSVSCIIRDRLGSEVTRYPSVHFIGIRFSYTDGVDTFSYDVSSASIGTSSYGTHVYTSAMQTADFGSIPGSLTVTIEPLNDITGAGPSSAGVTV